MAIAAVNSVSFRNNQINNQINFEGKKKENKSHSFHIPMSVKAIPIATLLAMSPLNATQTYAQTAPKEKLILIKKLGDGLVEKTSFESDKKEYNEYFKNNTTVYLDAFSNDNDDSTAEKIVLRFVTTHYDKTTKNGKPIDYTYMVTRAVELKELYELQDGVIMDDFGEYEHSYYVYGPYKESRIPGSTLDYRTTVTTGKEYSVENPYDYVPVSKEFFYYLKELMGDEVKYTYDSI